MYRRIEIHWSELWKDFFLSKIMLTTASLISDKMKEWKNGDDKNTQYDVQKIRYEIQKW